MSEFHGDDEFPEVVLPKPINTHLGRSSDGKVTAPYVTPMEIDPGLLVGVRRSINRKQYNIDDYNLPFDGYDVWNAYEFSALTDSGFPVVGQVKIVYAADTLNIVESKSLKLYLNSFNMVKLGKDIISVLRTAGEIISHDLIKLLNTNVKVNIFGPDTTSIAHHSPFTKGFKQIDFADVADLKWEYNENPALLKLNMNNRILAVHTTSLRSNCRVTNQPDWGDVYIYMDGRSCDAGVPTEESVLQYIVSMRNENHFHEEICECIYKRLKDAFNPVELFVACLYTRRGGIDINPIRASSEELITRIAPELVGYNRVTKTWRQ